MKLFVTIYEETVEAALRAIRAIRADHDGVELRSEKFPDIDLHAVRAATTKPILLTHRGGPPPDVRRAIEAGIDLVDIEWHEDVEIAVPERTVLSHHDYEGMRDVEAIMVAMRARGCAHTKLAATPGNFADNERLLSLCHPERSRGIRAGGEVRAPHTPRSLDYARDDSLTVIGMGERGLYSRILAPFRGSELAFVAMGDVAAPGQLTLDRALEIYGRAPQPADKVFAIVGNPAGHSLSPSIHNRLFREKGVPGAYTIASIASFDEITAAFLRGEPCGLSVTAPFKDDAFAFAERAGADIGRNAQRARAVNTLVNVGGRVLADNTDVDGFAELIPKAHKAAIVGAGGTGRAARVALEDAGIPVTVYNRTASKGDASLNALQEFDGDLVINTLPGGVDLTLPPCEHVIEVAYGAGRTEGLALLHAQARRQHQLFMRVFDGL